jgi:hypothetical protein
MQTFTQECEAVKKGATTLSRMTFNLSKQNDSQRIDTQPNDTYPKDTEQNMLSVVYSNVCGEKGSLLSFVYKFGWVARRCC